MTEITKDVEWIEDNQYLLDCYLYEQEPESLTQREYLESLFLDFKHAYTTRTILEDFQKSNEEKLNYFLDKFKTQSLIVSVIADRGQGKTAFNVFFLEKLSKFKKIYALYPFPKLPFINIIYDISECPSNSILYIDELAKKYKARDFASDDASAMTDELIGLRHNDVSIIGSTQDLALIDINFVRLSDVVCWKYYNVQKSELTREGFITDLIKKLMPKKDCINDILINDRGEVSTFTFPFSPYSKEISKYLSNLRNDKPNIIEYLSKYHEKRELIKLLRTQYNIRLTLEEQKQILNKK